VGGRLRPAVAEARRLRLRAGQRQGDLPLQVDGYESKLLVDGDVIWSEQLKMTHATKQPDLAAAKAAQGL
jgi:hypothetical protein